MPADSASTTIAVGTYEVDDPWRGNLTVLMEGGWQYTHGGIDYAISPSTAPNHHPGRLEGGPVLSGLQLLTLGRHRFVSLRSSDDRGSSGSPPAVGTWTTKPMELPRCPAGQGLGLTLNAEAGIDGFVAPELQLSGGARLVGAPLVGNDVAHEVVWGNATQLPAPAQGATATLTVQLALADLYAFAFHCG